MQISDKQATFSTSSVAETKKAGALLAQEILQLPQSDSAFIIALQGELGAGKTSFVQGFARGLGITEKVLSPTFIIMKSYPIPLINRTLYHIDCYRLKNEEDLLSLGWKELALDPQNIILIEWADRVKKALSKRAFVLRFDATDREKRTITMLP